MTNSKNEYHLGFVERRQIHEQLSTYEGRIMAGMQENSDTALINATIFLVEMALASRLKLNGMTNPTQSIYQALKEQFTAEFDRNPWYLNNTLNVESHFRRLSELPVMRCKVEIVPMDVVKVEVKLENNFNLTCVFPTNEDTDLVQFALFKETDGDESLLILDLRNIDSVVSGVKEIITS